MAKLTGTYVSSQSIGNREDLTDAIYMISPEKTPFTSMVGKSSAKNVLHEWQQDTLAAPDTANARPEGNEAAFVVPAPTVRLGNYCQISDKTAIVSATLEKINKAGRKSEMGYQMAKRSAELKRDVESILLANQAAVSADPRALGGLPAWIKSNTDKGAAGVDPVYTTVPTVARTDGTLRTLTETMLKGVVQKAWIAGGEPDVIMAGAVQKTAVSGFAGNASKVYNMSTAKPGVIVAAMDVYVSDFGTLKVVPNRWQRVRDVFVLDADLLEISYLRGYSTTPLAKTGDAEKRLINLEYTLVAKNETGIGAIYDLQ